jgi:hypothetical protein
MSLWKIAVISLLLFIRLVRDVRGVRDVSSYSHNKSYDDPKI